MTVVLVVEKEGRGVSVSEERQLSSRPGAIIPINTEGFTSTLKSFREKHTIIALKEVRLPDDILKELQIVSDLAHHVTVPWITDASIVVPIADAKSFQTAVKQKMLGIAHTLVSLGEKMNETCMKAMMVVSESTSESDKEEAVSACLEAIEYLDKIVLAYLLSLDKLKGPIQANLPASIMPNTIKGRSGFFSG